MRKEVIKKIGFIFITTIVLVLLFLLTIIFVFEKGPSNQIRDLFVATVDQSSAAKPLARLFLSKETVNQILSDNSFNNEEIISNADNITISNDIDKDEIIIEDIYGPTYTGKMMIVNDPSRIDLYCVDQNADKGRKVSEVVEELGGIAGINGGGFEDLVGTGNGSKPLGIVMVDGEWINGNKAERQSVIGFDNDNKLVVGYMTGYQAIERGVKDAVCWQPPLIIDGENVAFNGLGGLNPRTAIGQRADGAVLLLVINGRHANSIGAGYLDLAGIMMDYGAVVAGNLDGGNSSVMVYKGEILNNLSAMDGEREIPTMFIVK